MGAVWQAGSAVGPAAPELVNIQNLNGQFADPGPAYRGKPFWSWNGALDKDELLRQARVLKQMGMGGFFMHSRTGLQTEYLGKDWFHLINACADEAVRLKMEAWLYDEDRWPSGTAGGMVTQNPKFRQKFLSLRTIPAEQFKWDITISAAFACDLNNLSFTSAQRIGPDNTPAPGQTVLAFSIEEMDPSTFFNGFTDVDRLNRAATAEFLKLTHEKYRLYCGDRLGSSIKGIFTDEPHHGAVFSGFSLDNTNKLRMTPWTEALPEQFRKRFGYDLVDKLPELFLQKDGQAVAEVKWQYMELLQSMFLDNFSKPIFEWCQTNKIQFTGHYLHEDSLVSQAAMQGSLMRAYEYMHQPGVDVLTEGNRNYWIVKQLASTARQLNQPWLMSELYGVTGWQFNFEGHKYVGDWQALFGINVRCHHLSWYTMEGEAKRDYPASIFYQSAWWRDYKFVEDYYSRLGLMLHQGQPVCDVLVLNPIESTWCQVGVGWANGLSARTPALQELEKGYREMFGWLTSAHIDFDYGDEEMLSRLGQTGRDGKGQPTVRLGAMQYHAVIVPRMVTLRDTTLAMLQAFKQAGGRVIFAGPAPAYVNAVKSGAPAELAAYSTAVPWDGEAVVDAVKKSVRVPVEITCAADGKAAGNVFCQLRSDGENQFLVAMNMDRTNGVEDAVIRVWGDRHQVAEWDCATAAHYQVPTQRKEGWVEFHTRFLPLGERVFVLNREPMAGAAERPVFKETGRQICTGPFAYSLSEDNVCVLDLAKWQLNDGAWEPENEVLKVDRAIRAKLNVPVRSGHMVQPWFQAKQQPKPKGLCQVRLNYSFVIETQMVNSIKVAIEHPERVSILLNGRPLDAKPNGWWVDPVFKTIPLPKVQLLPGRNEIELKVEAFHEGVNLEAIYLLGEFGVRLRGTAKHLEQLPATLAVGDLVAQGLPFYGGSVAYEIPMPLRTVKQTGRMFLETPKFEAACLKMTSGTETRYVAWQPYELEIIETPSLRGVVTLHAVLTRRNTFGPLHQVPVKVAAYGPGNWVTEGKGFALDYQLYPAGLLAPPVISWRKPVE